MAPKLILTGFMATGKSAVARRLARRLGWRLLECDAAIAARAGKPIPEIFRIDGEDYFRALEREIIAELTEVRQLCVQCGSPRPAVISTGGGTIADRGNFELLKRAGIIVGLTARPEVIARRIGPAAKSRPMLSQSGRPIVERIAELMEARREAYARAAITIDTSDLNADQVVEVILSRIARLGPERWRLSA
jgi:shikimate kinase